MVFVQGGSEVVDGAAAHLEEEEVVDDHGTSDGPKSDKAEVKVDSELLWHLVARPLNSHRNVSL
jgi:hypothetical protein